MAGAALALVIAGVGWARQDDYFAHRYDRPEDFRFQLDKAVRWAKPTSGLRIGVAGTSGAYNQYGFYGDDVDNYVQYVGRHLPEADFQAIETCAAFRQAVNDGELRLPDHHAGARPQQPGDREPLPRARLGEERPRPPGGPARGPRLGLPGHRPARAGRLHPGEPARFAGPTGRIGYGAVSGTGDYILGTVGLFAVVRDDDDRGEDDAARRAARLGREHRLCWRTRCSRSATWS